MKISQECKVLHPYKPCSRVSAVYIQMNQSVSKQFSNIKKYKNDAKNDSKISRSHFKNLENVTQYTPKVQMLASISEPFARGVKAPARVFRDLLLGTYGGNPLGPMLAFSEAPLVRFYRLFKRFR